MHAIIYGKMYLCCVQSAGGFVGDWWRPRAAGPEEALLNYQEKNQKRPQSRQQIYNYCRFKITNF